tara:strand:- start:836 stop:1051 length:216 start_codon:yes stop_codon:yes gene_type:complete
MVILNGGTERSGVQGIWVYKAGSTKDQDLVGRLLLCQLWMGESPTLSKWTAGSEVWEMDMLDDLRSQPSFY